MTAAQRATLEQMADYAERFAKVSAERGDPNGASWHQDRAEALRAALGTCGNCRYADTDEKPGWVLCAAPGPVADEFPFIYRLMRVDQRCTGWTAKEGA